MKKINVLVADDHEIVKDAVAMALTQSGEFSVSTTSSFAETKTKISESEDFDVVMLDLVMPGMDGIDSVQQIVDLNKDSAVVLFSGNVKPRFLQQAVDLGCSGLIPKNLPLKSLYSALKFIASGQVFMPVEPKTSDDETKASLLTQRDIFILQEVAGGQTNKEIAWKLQLSEVTIKAKMQAIRAKLDAKNRASAVIKARQMGII